MRLSVSVVLFGVVMLASACGGTTPEPTAATPADLTPINELRNRYLAAYNAGDAAAVADLFADDAVSLPDEHAPLEGRAAILQYLQEAFAQAILNLTVTPADTEITGDVAHEHGTFSVSATPKAGGAAMTDSGNYLVVLKRQADGAWKIHHDIGNANMPPAGVPTPAEAGRP